MSEEKIVCLLEDAAARAQFQIRLQIPLKVIHEMMKEKAGINISVIDGNDNQALCYLNWAEAFPNGLDPFQSFYVSGIVENFPQVQNWGQKLYLLALKACIQGKCNCTPVLM